MKMKINTDLIRRCSSRNLLPLQGEEDPLKRITHLYLQEQNIKTIENLHFCSNLLALYLYDNKIEKIQNLDDLEHLNCLYLQNNRITRIENLESLTRLTVLNLGHNAIPKVEGLEALTELRELYIEYQDLPDDRALELDRSSIAAVSDTLKVLSISGNHLRSLSRLIPLQCLETFLAEGNDLCDLQELVNVVSHWKNLQLMRLNGNPVCRIRKYRDNMVVSCLELEELDGKVVSQPYRNFLLNWKQCQTLQDLKRESYAVLRPFLEARWSLLRYCKKWKWLETFILSSTLPSRLIAHIRKAKKSLMLQLHNMHRRLAGNDFSFGTDNGLSAFAKCIDCCDKVLHHNADLGPSVFAKCLSCSSTIYISNDDGFCNKSFKEDSLSPSGFWVYVSPGSSSLLNKQIGDKWEQTDVDDVKQFTGKLSIKATADGGVLRPRRTQSRKRETPAYLVSVKKRRKKLKSIVHTQTSVQKNRRSLSIKSPRTRQSFLSLAPEVVHKNELTDENKVP